MNRSALQGASAMVALLVGLGLGTGAQAADRKTADDAAARVRKHVQALKETKPSKTSTKAVHHAKEAPLTPGIVLASHMISAPMVPPPPRPLVQVQAMAEPQPVADAADEVVVEVPVDLDDGDSMVVVVPKASEQKSAAARRTEELEARRRADAEEAARRAEASATAARRQEEVAQARELRRVEEIAAAEVPMDTPGVLTRKGTLVIEPSIEYTHTDINRFVVGGVAILDSVLVGSIEATQANRDAVTATLGLRYGITNRLEGELRLPFMYRNDNTTNTVVNSNNVAATTSLSDAGLGDIEGALHYQMNDGTGKWPVLVANFRAKSNTGSGPFDVSRNNLGVEEELATGSGFWGFEPSITMIAPSDPAVFFANIGYLWNVKKDVDKQITSTRTVNSVDPGDAIRVGIGMGLALNEKVSFSLGYQHDFIMGTDTQFNDGEFKSESLSVGSVTFGVNYQMSDTTALNVSVGIGVTQDSPDVRLMARLPIALSLF